LVAKSLLNTTAGAEIAFINAGVCLSDIPEGEMKVGDIRKAVDAHRLVTVAISGVSLAALLEEAMESVFGPSADNAAYPYAAGLRYDVIAPLGFNDRVSQIQLNLNGYWEPINHRRFYTVVTTEDLAGGDHGYGQFTKVIEDWTVDVPYKTTDAFFNFAMGDDDWWLLAGREYSTQSFFPADKELSIASVPQRICLEWTPGSGRSMVCSLDETADGGGACNLVAWALLDQNLRAQISILKAGDCGSDLDAGTFTQSDANALIPKNPLLVTIKLKGAQVMALLEQAVDATLWKSGARSDAYPYSAGLRFNVDASAEVDRRVSAVEVYTNSNRWVPLRTDETYTILTTSALARGRDPAYQVFLVADASTIRELPLGSVDTFIKYATEWGVLYDPPKEKYSTQAFSTD
jgi:2',3'-cyclic-nucleotide 2'-phosphodiesterase (5'-nucleotidase family)